MPIDACPVRHSIRDKEPLSGYRAATLDTELAFSLNGLHDQAVNRSQ